MQIFPIRHYSPRGSKKQFVKSQESVKSAGKLITDIISASESDDPNTLIDIKITNPLRKIYELIQEIKKHQSTTFSLKFTIPLIALPVFLFAAFQIGKGQGVCRESFTSKVGEIRNITVEIPQKKPGLLRSMFGFLPGTNQETIYIQEDQTILIDFYGNTTRVMHQAQIPLTGYENSKAIVTGNYSSCTGGITLVSDKNIRPF